MCVCLTYFTACTERVFFMYMYYSNDNESDQTAQMRLLIYILSYTVAARFWLGVTSTDAFDSLYIALSQCAEESYAQVRMQQREEGMARG